MRWALVAATILLAGCGSEHGVFVIDAGTGATTRITSPAQDVAWTPEGHVLVAADDVVKTYTAGGDEVRTREWPLPDTGTGLAVARDGRVAAVVEAGSVNGGDLMVNGRRVLRRAYGPPVWSADGRQLAALAMNAAEAQHEWGLPATAVGEILAPDGRRVGAFRGRPVGFLPDGSLLTLSFDNALFAGERQVADHVTQAAVAPDGWLAAITTIGSLWRSAPGVRDVRTVPGLHPFDPAWSPDGRRLAMFEDGRVLVLDRASNAASELVDFGRTSLSGLTWSPDGRRLLAVVDEWRDPD